MARKKNKAEKKEKEIRKYVKDRTFGMKNRKKGKHVEKMVRGLAGQEGGFQKLQDAKFKARDTKKKLEQQQKFMAEVFGGKVAMKAGEAKMRGKRKPICQFFKAGLCGKGRKCKFSHDLKPVDDFEEVEDQGNARKINLFKDQREEMFGGNDWIEDWNQAKLEEAVNFNAKNYGSSNNQTSIVCKFFLTAVEKMNYGWFWKCPNGFNCKFRHCLPEGYVFESKSKVKKDHKDDRELKIIQGIDAARDKLDSKKLTPVTEERFMKWCKRRRADKLKKREERIAAFNKQLGLKNKKKQTGRELFAKNKSLFKDAEGAVGNYKKKEETPVEVDEDVFGDDEVPDL